MTRVKPPGKIKSTVKILSIYIYIHSSVSIKTGISKNFCRELYMDVYMYVYMYRYRSGVVAFFRQSFRDIGFVQIIDYSIFSVSSFARRLNAKIR